MSQTTSSANTHKVWKALRWDPQLEDTIISQITLNKIVKIIEAKSNVKVEFQEDCNNIALKFKCPLKSHRAVIKEIKVICRANNITPMFSFNTTYPYHEIFLEFWDKSGLNIINTECPCTYCPTYKH